MAKGGVRVDGAKELRKAIRKAERDDLKKALKAANKDAAEVVAVRARVKYVPVRSGALRSSIRSLGSQTVGQVKAGRGKTSRYAGVIHFGNPRRNIKPQPFLYEALDDRRKEVFDQYRDQLDKISKELSSK